MQFILVDEWITCFPDYGGQKEPSITLFKLVGEVSICTYISIYKSSSWQMLLQQLNEFAVANQECDLGNISPK